MPAKQDDIQYYYYEFWAIFHKYAKRIGYTPAQAINELNIGYYSGELAVMVAENEGGPKPDIGWGLNV